MLMNLQMASQISTETDYWEVKPPFRGGLTGDREQPSLVLGRVVVLWLCACSSCRLVCVYGCRMVALELSDALLCCQI